MVLHSMFTGVVILPELGITDVFTYTVSDGTNEVTNSFNLNLVDTMLVLRC